MIGKDVRRYVVATEGKKGQRVTELVSAAVLLAVCRSGARVGGAAIKVARSRSTMLPADTPCLGKCFAAFYLALFSGATAMPAAHSLRRRTGGSGAVAERAVSERTMLSADPPGLDSSTAPSNRARPLLCMRFAVKSPRFSVVAAAFGRAEVVRMLAAQPPHSHQCHDLQQSWRHFRNNARCIGAAAIGKTLALACLACPPVFCAQASCGRLVGAAFHRARLPVGHAARLRV